MDKSRKGKFVNLLLLVVELVILSPIFLNIINPIYFLMCNDPVLSCNMHFILKLLIVLMLFILPIIILLRINMFFSLIIDKINQKINKILGKDVKFSEIVLILIGFSLVVSTINYVNLNFFPGSPCDCVEASKIIIPSNTDPELSLDACIFRYIRKTGNYQDCIYFGQRCAQEILIRGVSCRHNQCDTYSKNEIEKILYKDIELCKKYNENILSNNIQESLAAYKAFESRLSNFNISNIEMYRRGSFNYLKSKGCST